MCQKYQEAVAVRFRRESRPQPTILGKDRARYSLPNRITVKHQVVKEKQTPGIATTLGWKRDAAVHLLVTLT